MSQPDESDTIAAIRSASTLTEATFLHAGQALEASVDILAKLTSSFEAVLTNLQAENLGQALKALSHTATQVSELGQERSGESSDLEHLCHLTDSIRQRVSQMNTSLKNIESLAVNSKIAAANIKAQDGEFVTFADEIGRTLQLAKQTLDSFAAELQIVQQHVSAAHASQLVFQKVQHEAGSSITERLSATVTSIALRHQRAARSGREVKLGSIRVHQRVCNAILALQIGDITRQRLEHADYALGLVAGVRDGADAGHPALSEDHQRMFAAASGRLQAAQLSDAARDFERDVHRIIASLESLATEAKALQSLGNAAYGSSEGDGGSFINELETQVGEALALFQGFETAQAAVAEVTAQVSQATFSLSGHLKKVLSLEDDIRIMGLNTTFKCARIGREGLALSLIAQELRTYANGFAKEAGALMREVENVTSLTLSLSGEPNHARLMTGGAKAMRDSNATLRQMGEVLDVAMADLERDSDRVVALLVATASDLQARNDIGDVLRGVAATLTALAGHERFDLTDLPPPVGQMLEVMAGGYTMANERAMHDRMLGRKSVVATVQPAAAEMEDFLF